MQAFAAANQGRKPLWAAVYAINRLIFSIDPVFYILKEINAVLLIKMSECVTFAPVVIVKSETQIPEVFLKADK